MSAIVGIFFMDGRPVEVRNLESMVETVAKWGPDGTGLWNSGSIGLGHRMLHTTPESLAEQLPFAQKTSKLVITADARIDNRKELIAGLDITDRPAEGISDSELILHAYERWGESCPERLLGDFAFAIWDGRREQLFCARDPMGARPFYYYRSDRVFIFSTEIKSLFCIPEVPRQLNEALLAEYFAMIQEQDARTLYQHIFRLPAANHIIANRRDFRIQSYWSLDTSRELHLRSDAEYADAFRDVFTQAVRCRLRSAFPVGSMLSGGLDSSSIVCVARNLIAADPGSRLPTFSAIFPSLADSHSRANERPYMDAVTAQGRLEPHYVPADNLCPFLGLLWQEDEVLPAASAYMDWAIFDAARKEGVRVLLSGNDGDTVVHYGYEYLAELFRAGRWSRLFKEGQALSRKTGQKPRRLIWRFGVKPFMPEAALQLLETLREYGKPVWDQRALINPAFAIRTDLPELVRSRLRQQKPARTAREAHGFSLTAYNIPWTLESLAKLASTFSLELRYPFFDRRLVEFCLSLPGDQKLREGWNRWVLRRSMAGILPPEVQWRKGKGSNTPNFNRRLLEDGRAILDEVILGDSQMIAEYVDVQALRAAYGRYKLDPMRESGDAFSVFWVVVIALWLRSSGLGPR